MDSVSSELKFPESLNAKGRSRQFQSIERQPATSSFERRSTQVYQVDGRGFRDVTLTASVKVTMLD